MEAKNEKWQKILENIKIRNKILELKEKLKESDYKAIKFAEGELTAKEYASTKAERKAWRKQINKLEALLLNLKGEKL